MDTIGIQGWLYLIYAGTCMNRGSSAKKFMEILGGIMIAIDCLAHIRRAQGV